jgi:hypothetical protein
LVGTKKSGRCLAAAVVAFPAGVLENRHTFCLARADIQAAALA